MRSWQVVIGAAFAVFSLTSASQALAQEMPPANPDPNTMRQLEQMKCTHLLTNRQVKDYSVTLDLNGIRNASYGSGSGWKTDPIRFKAGTNHAVVNFTPTPTKDAKSQAGTLTLVLADTAQPQPNHSLILYTFSAADNAWCSTDLTFDFVDGHAVNPRVLDRRWADAAHKNLVYEMSTTGGNVWGPYDQHERQWSRNGQPVEESVYKLSKKFGSLRLVESKDYKPDGTLAAEVKDGFGLRKAYSDGGVMLLEAQYRDGAMNGPYKGFDNHGVLRVSGNYKDDQQDGLWVRFDDRGHEDARCVYNAGQPQNGANPIDPNVATASHSP